MRCLGLFSLIMVALLGNTGYAGTITVPLSLSPTTLPDGEALIGEFDFDNTFRQIDSVVVEFVLPGGFHGDVGSTGNSTFGSYFSVFMLPLNESSPRLPVRSRAGFSQPLLRVPANQVQRLSFYSLYDFEEPVRIIWPNQILEGSGRIAFAEVRYSSFHPLPAGDVVSSTSTLVLPNQVTDAHLVITGDLIPEPTSCLLLTLASLLVFAPFRSRQPIH